MNRMKAGATLSVRLDDAEARALDEAARRTGQTKGRIVKDALRAHLRATEGSALAALSSLSGIVRGPRDLSTNKKRLAGLGRSSGR